MAVSLIGGGNRRPRAALWVNDLHHIKNRSVVISKDFDEMNMMDNGHWYDKCVGLEQCGSIFYMSYVQHLMYNLYAYLLSNNILIS